MTLAGSSPSSQLGLTFIGFLASAFAAVSLADGLATLLVDAGMDVGTAGGVALVTVTVILALFTIVFARARPEVAGARQQRALRAHACQARSTSSDASWGRSSRR